MWLSQYDHHNIDFRTGSMCAKGMMQGVGPIKMLTHRAESSAEGGSHFSSKGLHGRNIDDLEVVLLNDALPHVLPNLPQH